MATVRNCYRADCKCNVGAEYCNAYEIIVGINGSCLTYSGKDIYEDAEEESEDETIL